MHKTAPPAKKARKGKAAKKAGKAPKSKSPAVLAAEALVRFGIPFSDPAFRHVYNQIWRGLPVTRPPGPAPAPAPAPAQEVVEISSDDEN